MKKIDHGSCYGSDDPCHPGPQTLDEKSLEEEVAEVEREALTTQSLGYACEQVDVLILLRLIAELAEKDKRNRSLNGEIDEERACHRDTAEVLQEKIYALEAELSRLREAMENAATALQNGYRDVGLRILNDALRGEGEKA